MISEKKTENPNTVETMPTSTPVRSSYPTATVRYKLTDGVKNSYPRNLSLMTVSKMTANK